MKASRSAPTRALYSHRTTAPSPTSVTPATSAISATAVKYRPASTSPRWRTMSGVDASASTAPST